MKPLATKAAKSSVSAAIIAKEGFDEFVERRCAASAWREVMALHRDGLLNDEALEYFQARAKERWGDEGTTDPDWMNGE